MKKKLISLMCVVLIVAGVCVMPAFAKMSVDMTNTGTKLVALKNDGTVKINGYNLINNAVLNELTDVVEIACEDFDENSFFALKKDGTVQVVYKFARDEYNMVRTWQNITSIDAGNGVVFGLTSTGTIVMCGKNTSYYAGAKTWTNIKSIYAKEDTLIGITNDGKVLCQSVTAKSGVIASWTNMKKVVYDIHCFWGITNDGQLISTDAKYKEDKVKGKELLGDFVDIEAMSAYGGSGFYSRVLALKADGTLVDVTNHTTKYGDYTATVLYNDIASFVTSASNYAAVLKSGEILSDKFSISSTEWILGIDIRVAGKYVDCDVPPYIKNSRTMVPIRAISEALGAVVTYDDATKTANISRGNTLIKVTMNNTVATVNGVAHTLDAAAENVDGRIFVPVRFVSEGFGCNVQWDPEVLSVLIN